MFGKWTSPWRVLLLLGTIWFFTTPLFAQSSGQKYILSVGINQYAEKPLKGCVNDANGMFDLLTRDFGFNREQSQVLTDQQATRSAILNGLQRFLNQTRSGDLFVLFYSGHGLLWPDELSEERDEQVTLNLAELRAQRIDLPDGKYDSALVPFDAAEPGPRRWRNLILDDELYAVFAQMTAKCVNVVLISDSCHSGSLSKGLSLTEETTEKFLDPQTLFHVRVAALPPPAASKAIPSRNFYGRYLALTSSQDNQLSLDGIYEERRQGLFTYALRKVIMQSPALTYNALYERAAPLVRARSEGRQWPSLDTRYFGGNVAEPLFANAGNSCGAGGAVQVRLQLRNRAGEPLPNASFALFKAELRAVPERIERADTLLILRTNSQGEAIGEVADFANGEYLVKAVSQGYQSFAGRVRLLKREQRLPVLIVLDPE